MTARQSTGSPRNGRPRASASSTTPAITPARSTLACGVTSTTNPVSVTSAAATRMPRRAPIAEASAHAMPTTTAQFAPDTAVRWLRELAFIAASRSPPTAVVSPIASPGSSPPPGDGEPVAVARNACRSPSVAAKRGPGPAITSSRPRGKTRNATSSPGSAATSSAVSRTTEPIGIRSPSRSPKTRTGTLPRNPTGPTRATETSPGNLPSIAVPLVVSSRVTIAPACAASRSSTGARSPIRLTAMVATSAAATMPRPR